jgi:hypothetical protein
VPLEEVTSVPNGWAPIEPPAPTPEPRGSWVLLSDVTGVWWHHVTLLERIEAHLHADRLDEQLASGALPESSPLLELRAVQICRPSQRRLLARSVRRLLEDADAPDESIFARRPLALLARVRRARTELMALLDRLEHAGPVSARGVAAVRLLLSDGTGPLYREDCPQPLERAVRQVAALLDPSLDWKVA